MDVVRTRVSLANPKRFDLAPIEVDALVDTGAVHLCLPSAIARHVDLYALELRAVTVADGSTHQVPYAGPVRTSFGDRSCYAGAMVLGDEVLLGSIPMDDMDLVVRPVTRQVIANPASPNIPASIAKGFHARLEGDV